MTQKSELLVDFTVFYDTPRLIPPREIASALLALDGILRESPFFFNSLIPGKPFQHADVYLSKITTGSLYEDLFIKFVFGGQEQYDQFISWARSRLGIQNIMEAPGKMKKVLAALGGVIVLGGGLWLLDIPPFSRGQTINQLQANNNVIIQIGAGELGMTPEEFANSVFGVMDHIGKRRSRKLANNSVETVRPLIGSPGGSIIFNGIDDARITSEAIEAFPDTSREIPDEYSDTFDRVIVEIRALDRDNKSQGWSVRIPSVQEKRIRAKLAPHINSQTLAKKEKVIATVSVDFRRDSSGETAISCEIQEIHKSTQD